MRAMLQPSTEIMRKLLKPLGQRVRKAREDLGLSQEQLAERAGLHVSYVGQIERGLREPSLKSLFGVAEGLNLRLVDLVAEEPVEEDRLLRELRRTIGTLEPPQQREVLGIIRRMVGLVVAKARKRNRG
jgi:transcriptional regulator with XRE-family HTH domain